MSVTLAALQLGFATPVAAAITEVIPSHTAVLGTAGAPITPVTYTLTGTPDGTEVTFATVDPLPAGLTVDAVTGTLTGTPDHGQSTTITVTATDPGPLPDPSDDVTITATPVLIDITELSPRSQPALVGVVGVPLTSATLTPIGLADPVTYSLDPPVATLPDGLTFDEASGVISGTPTAPALAATFTITGTSGDRSAASTVSLEIPPAAVSPSASTVDGTVGTALTPLTFTATGFAVTPTLWTISPVDLPSGVAFDATTATLSGTPTTAWPTTTYTVTASDEADPTPTTATATVDLTVAAAALPARTVTGIVGTTITPTLAYQATELEGAGLVAPVTFTVAPALPNGLLLAASTGVVSGKPTVPTAADAEFTVTATDANGATATALLTLTIDSAQLLPPTIYVIQPGTNAGSLRVLFLGPANAPTGQIYAAEVYDEFGSTLVKALRPFTSLTDITGLTPGTTYTVVIVAEPSLGYLGSRSPPRAAAASWGGTKPSAPSITSATGGPTPGSIVISFSKSANAPVGATYSVQVFDEDQLSVVKILNAATSPATVTGLTPGVSYFVVVSVDATATTVASLSRGRLVTATAGRSSNLSVAQAATVASAATSANGTGATFIGGGWLRPAAGSSTPLRVALKRPLSRTRAAAAAVTIPRSTNVRIALSGAAPGKLHRIAVLVAGAWSPVGTSRAKASGAIALPVVSVARSGTFLLRLTATGSPPLYAKVRVR